MAVFRIEKTKDYTVMANHHLKNRSLSLKAKGLLSVILSLPENWNYTTRGLASICKEGVDCISATLSELEQNGYIVRNRLRDEKGRITDTEYVIYEKPVAAPKAASPAEQPSPASPSDAPRHDTVRPQAALPHMVNPPTAEPQTAAPYAAHPCTENPYMDMPDTENPAQLNTIVSKTNPESKKQTTTSIYPSTHPSITPSNPNPYDPDDIATQWRRLVRGNIDYLDISETYALRIDQLDEIVELMVETLCSQRPTIAVAGDELPASLVKGRLLKINAFHIEYVMDSLKKNTSEIRNIKRYLLTVLFNAPSTMDNHYTAQFQHDYYGGGHQERVSG